MTAPKSVTARQAYLYTEKVDSKVSSLDSRYTDDLASFRSRLDKHDKHVKVSSKQHDRLERLVADVGNRLAADHDAIFELNQRFARMDELVADGLKINLAASIVGFTSEEIKEILAIQAEDDLTDSAVITGMVNQIGRLNTVVDMVVDTVAETRGIVNDHTDKLSNHDEKLSNFGGRVTHIETAFKEVKLNVMRQPEELSKAPLVMGVVAAIVTFFVAQARDDVSNWLAIGFAIGFGAIAAGILSFFVSWKIAKINETKKLSSSTTSGKTAETDVPTRSSASDDRTTVQPPKGRTEPAPDLATAGS